MARTAQDDPIVAVATASGRGAVGIVRVSGRGLGPLIERLCGRAPSPRQATLAPVLAGDGSVIDTGLAIFFAAPHSYTGEDVLELQVHGGPVVVQLVLNRCLAAAAEPLNPHQSEGPAVLPGLRLAEPGEFTQRAFLNGKLDLAQAEAVADLIDASTEAAARSATRSLAGEFSQRVKPLRDRLIALRALVEATLDFPEEEIDFLQRADAVGQLSAIQADLLQLQAQAKAGSLLREGMTVVLAGQPNVGKSSLLNALAGNEVAIVTAAAGTTRDRLQHSLQIDGVPVHVIDTAGLRDPHDAVDEAERIGISRSWAAIEDADAVLFVHDVGRIGQPDYERANADILAHWPALQAPSVGSSQSGAERRLNVLNKADLLQAGEGDSAEHVGDFATNSILTSARTGQGLAELRQRLLTLAGWHAQPEGVFIARSRHLDALRRTQTHVQAAAQWLAAPQTSLELLAEELRLAHEALGEITGAFTSDDLLGVIFGRFCIGK